MAQASRRKAERLFGMDSVNAELLKALHLV
jgi:hypothetical protein